ncbi:hypothetical protein [Paenibacillus lemnae]|uniref:Uncharacterized protein n=1 Tax=Paenibacillus lemnae TaxID=1330551 RepID=A0A848M239_PAELE|nr:hypothetical protein [Paenibacillus lemnae]NMO94321.1 hypothetical protein [Paenibacillus lemnae]
MSEAVENTQEWVREIGQRELFFLMNMVEHNGIAGFSDPYSGYLIDELEDEWAKIRGQLLERELLMADGDDLAIEPVLEAFLAVLDSSYAVRLELKRGGKTVYDAYLHLLPQMVVERVQTDSGDGEGNHAIRLSAIASLELSLPLIEQVFPAEAAAQGTIKQPFTLPVEVYDSLMSGSETEGAKALDPGLSPDAKALKSLMEQADFQGRMTLMQRSGPVWRQQVMTCGIGEDGGWIARRDEEQGVRVENYRRGKLGQAVRALVQDVLAKSKEDGGGDGHDENQN